MNNRDIKDAIICLFIAVIVFTANSDSVFPFIIFALKAIFYILGSFMGILGLTIIVRSIFGKSNKYKNADKHNAI